MLGDGIEVQIAVGLLMQRGGVVAAVALDQLHDLSRQQARPLQRVAHDLLTTRLDDQLSVTGTTVPPTLATAEEDALPHRGQRL